MKKNFRVFAICILLIACSVKDNEKNLISPSSVFCMDKALVDKFSKKKNFEKSDLAMISSIYNHYAFCWNKLDIAEKWANIGAELGDREMQETVIASFLIKRTPEDEKKAEELKNKWGIID